MLHVRIVYYACLLFLFGIQGYKVPGKGVQHIQQRLYAGDELCLPPYGLAGQGDVLLNLLLHVVPGIFDVLAVGFFRPPHAEGGECTGGKLVGVAPEALLQQRPAQLRKVAVQYGGGFRIVLRDLVPPGAQYVHIRPKPHLQPLQVFLRRGAAPKLLLRYVVFVYGLLQPLHRLGLRHYEIIKPQELGGELRLLTEGVHKI